MDILTQAKKYGFRIKQGKNVVLEHIFRKQSIGIAFFFIAFGIFKLAVRPSPILGGINILCGIVLIIWASQENKNFPIRNLDIKHVVCGNGKIAIEYKSGRVERYEAGMVEKFDVDIRRSGIDKYVGTLSLIDTTGKQAKLAVILDKDEDKVKWFLEGVGEALAQKINEEPAEAA